MKKTSIYLLSVLSIIVLALSVLLPSGKLVKAGVDAISSDYSSEYSEVSESNISPIGIVFHPSASTMVQPSDSIQFSDGLRLPFVIDEVVVLAPNDKIPEWTSWFFMITTPINILFFIIIIWKFVRFIINVSKEKIFESQNVRYLRQISWSLIAIALIRIAQGLVNNYTFSMFHFSWPGYELGAHWTFPWNNLLFGTIGLLLAPVWSYGLAIKKEQELTI